MWEVDSKTKHSLVHDINAVFDKVVYRLVAKQDWVDVELDEDYEITMLDFPHLLTIAKNYNVTIKIYPIESSRLGIYFKEDK